MSAPQGRLRTLAVACAMRDARGEVAFWVGNSAVVFLAEGSGAASEEGGAAASAENGGAALAGGGTDAEATPPPERLALKCHTRWPVHAGAIYDYVAAVRDALLPQCRLLQGEIFVHDAAGTGAWHDMVVGLWIEGITLQTALRRALREGGFAELSAAFERMAVALLSREWAHGDLKPENIIVCESGEMALVDLDAMWIPLLRGAVSAEVGTPQYQHPARDEHYFCKAIDDFPAALIAVSLRALALDPTLWERYNDGDNIILYPEQVVGVDSVAVSDASGASMSAFDEVLRLFSERGEYHSLRLAHALRSPTPAIEGLREMLLATSADAVQWAYSQEDSGLFEHQTRFSGSVPRLGGAAPDAANIEPVAAVCAHGVWKIVRADGTVRASCPDWDYIKPFSGGIAAARKGEKWGYITADAEVLVEPRFDIAATMHEGRAVVGMRNTVASGGAAASHGGTANMGRKYGFIDARGAIVVPLEWDFAGSFRQGRATVARGNTDLTIDRDGKIIND